jgi:predicted RNA-binding protein with RPS1 domain
MSDSIAIIVAAVGGSGVAIIAIAFLLISNPDKVQLWTAWLWKGVRFASKKAEYSYIAADVAGNLNAHLRRHLTEEMEGPTIPRIAIRWTNSPETITAESPGTLIVRMRPHRDRAANILHASMAVTPRIVIPTLRSQLRPEQSQGIDLQLCRRLAEETSATAVTTYRLSILDPALSALPNIGPVLDELNTVDLSGLFLPVLIQELTKLAAVHPLDSLPGLADEVAEFSSYLRTVGERSPGDDVDLEFVGRYFKVNILLVAKAETKAIGVGPYRARVTRELAEGVESFYVMATERNIGFANAVVDALESDLRLIRHKSRALAITRAGRRTSAVIVPFERNASLATGEHFRKIIAGQGLRVGSQVNAIVLDVRPDYTLCDVGGLQGVIRPGDMDWFWTDDCSRVVSIGDEISTQVLHVDPQGGEVRLSRKAMIPHPLQSQIDKNLLGSTVTMEVDRAAFELSLSSFASGRSTTSPVIPLRLFWEEVDWGATPEAILDIEPGMVFDVVIIKVDREFGFCAVSRKRIAADRWEVIRARYPKGKELVLKAKKASESGVLCEVEPGLTGLIPAAEFRQAGYEYEKFEERIRIGDELYVYVSRAVGGLKERLTLGLQRNVKQRG